MIILSLTEEDRALLLPLQPAQRDQVFLALLAGMEAGAEWGKVERETLEAIRRRERSSTGRFCVWRGMMRGMRI